MVKAIWFVPPVLHALAESDGLLSKFNISVDSRLTSSSDEQFEALQDGICDFCVTSMDNMVMWKRRSDGGALRIVAQVEATIGIDLVARPEFASIRDLNGQRLLVDSAENGFVIALHKLIADAGLDYHRCAVIEAGGVRQRLAALIEGKGDAALLGPPFTEMAESQGMVRIASANESYPGFAGQGIIMRTDASVELQDELARYLGALEEARARCRHDPEAALAKLTAAGNRKIMEILVSAVGDTLVPDRAGIEMIIEHRRVLGRPGGDESYDGLVDRSLLDRAIATTSL